MCTGEESFVETISPIQKLVVGAAASVTVTNAYFRVETSAIIEATSSVLPDKAETTLLVLALVSTIELVAVVSAIYYSPCAFPRTFIKPLSVRWI